MRATAGLRLGLRGGPPALEIAVDPRLIPLGSYVHVWPNPFGTHRAFYAGDTGSAIVGRHIDIYDWRGRADQEAWGVRAVSVTPASGSEEGGGEGCEAPLAGAQLQLVASDTARVLTDGSAAAPAGAPAAVKEAIAAGNLIHALPYPEPDAHFGSLARLWPAYDCSGAVSFALYGGATGHDLARLERARELWPARARAVDHGVRERRARVDRRGGNRARYRGLRRAGDTGRVGAAVAGGTAG